MACSASKARHAFLASSMVGAFNIIRTLLYPVENGEEPGSCTRLHGFRAHVIPIRSAPRALRLRLLRARPFAEQVHTVDRMPSTSAMRNLASIPFAASRDRVHPSEVQVLPHLVHDHRIRDVLHRDLQLVGDVLLGIPDPHAPGHLHAGYKISCSAHSADAGGDAMGHRHPEGIADANLQPVQPGDVDHAPWRAG